MTGKNCVGIAWYVIYGHSLLCLHVRHSLYICSCYSDLRLGAQFMTVDKNFTKIFEMNDRLYVGLPGLATDVLTLKNLLTFRCNMYKLKENRDISPEAFNGLVSTLLYEKRFGPYFCEPIIAGLKDDNTPYLSGMDLIGAPVLPENFCVSGTCTPNMHGLCEAMFKPDMEKEELFEVLSQCLLSAVDRDALSG